MIFWRNEMVCFHKYEVEGRLVLLACCRLQALEVSNQNDLLEALDHIAAPRW